MQIHINRDGQDFGPYTLEQVNQYLQEGSIVPTDMAWHEGMPDWMPLPKVEGVEIPADALAETGGGGGKKTVLWLSLAAVAAAIVVGGIVFVVVNKGGGKAAQTAQTEGSGESGSGGTASSGSSGGGGMDSGMGMDNGMGMDGDMSMDMDGDMAMGMGMDGPVDSGKVLALFEQKCFKCHGNGKKKGGYTMDTRDAALDAIKPGNPNDSLIMELVRRDDPDSAMPPKDADALSKAEVAMVAAWIKAGAKF